MNRVTMINLAGRALYVEDEGVEAIHGWLESARATLAADPDRDELLADFEEAIADRCHAVAPGATDVVTTLHVEDVLTALGSVEPADVEPSEGIEGDVGAGEGAGDDGLGEGGDWGDRGDGSEGADDDGEPTDDEEGEPLVGTASAAGAGAGAGSTPLRQRRLYRLTGEGEGVIAGVAAGIASYLNVDVTVVRLAAIISAVVSLGTAVLLYVVLALIVPAADSPGERLAAQGYGDSAKEVMSRARTNARPALSSVGEMLRGVVGLIASVVYWSLLFAISVVVIGGTVAVAWVFVDPEPLATAFDDGTSTWAIALWVSSGFWLAVGVLTVLAALTRRLAAPAQAHMLGAAAAVAGLALMTAAAIGLVGIPVVASAQARSLMDGEGEIEIFGEVWCLTPEYGFEEDIDDCDARSSSAVIGREWVIDGTLRLPELDIVERQLLLVEEQIEERVSDLDQALRERRGRLELRLGR